MPTTVKQPRSSSEHSCTLKEVDTTGLPQLPPNTSRFAKCLRYIRILTLLNTDYKESRTFFRNKSAMIAERKRHAKGYFFVLHPFSTLTFLFDWLFFITWTYDMFTVFMLYYLPVEGSYFMFRIQERTLDIIRSLVMFSFFIKGYVDSSNREICIQPKTIIKKYLESYFLIDLICVFMSNLVAYFIPLKELRDHHYTYHYILSSTVMLTYFIRTPSLISTLERIVSHYGFGDYVFFLFSRTVATLFFLDAFTCIMASLPRLIFGGDLPDQIFLVRAKLHDLSPGTNTNVIDVFSKTFLLVSCTFFGLNYNKVDITEISDYIPLICIRMFGRMFTLFTLASFLKYFGRSGIAESKYEQYLSQLKEFMMSKNLPGDLRKRILTYYEFKMQRNYFDEKNIKNTLSVPLRNELFLYGAKKWIDRTPLLKNVGSVALGSLFAHMSVETYLMDDVLFHCDVQLYHVYFIACGTIVVYSRDGLELGHFTDGEQIGIINMWTGHASSYKAVAGETTEIYRIHKKYIREFLLAQPHLTKYYEKIEAERISRFAIAKELMKGRGSDVIAQLRRKKILERRTIRQFIID